MKKLFDRLFIILFLLLAVIALWPHLFYIDSKIRINDIVIPEYDGETAIVINDNKPLFSKEEISNKEFENYSPLDKLGRCGVAFGNISIATMPKEERTSIQDIKPSAWKYTKYDQLIDKDNPNGNLYNRCHLIAYCLAAENDNPLNLITGTRHLNETMQIYEEQIMDYCYRSNNHVLYRVTPIFKNNELLCRGVLLEAYSLEDIGLGISFCVFVNNVQPGIMIDYLTGDSSLK